jgi:hypothetical protein
VCEKSDGIINSSSNQLDYHYLFIIKFKWTISMINAEDDIIVNLKTSCTKDEAAAMLLGWLKGPIRPRSIQITEDGLSLDQLPFLHSLEGSLQEQLQELVDTAIQAFRFAAESGADLDEMVKKEKAVEDRRALVLTAARFARDIDDEVYSPDNSKLKIDQFETDRTGEQHILISSLDRWAQEKYAISILMNDLDDPSVVGGTSKGRAKPESKELSPTKAKNIHITIALLVEAFIENAAKKYVNDGKPNIKEIATHLSNIFGARCDNRQSGQSFEAIRKRLTEAMKVYHEELPPKDSR